jgi:hypothetical protein
VGVEGNLALQQVSEPFFGPYDAAVNSFLLNGGHAPSIIRSPPSLLKQYRSHFAGSSNYAHGTRIEEAEQDHVSVRGTTIGGHDYEWPEPD